MKGDMIRWAGSLVIGLWTAGAGPQALAAIAPSGTGITNTKHNLTITGTGTNQFTPTNGTGEICVFCHTPHGADTSASVPLWNRRLAVPETYTTYNSLGTSSLDGATAPVGSVSLACLSCHDGTQAMNVMINQPGSGGYNAGGLAMPGTWAGLNQTDGKIGATLITNIGQDLRNDHPVGIQYGGGPKSGITPPVGTTYDRSLFKDADFNDARSALLNGQAVWWVDTLFGTTAREKTDMQLYTRIGSNSNDGTLTGAQPFVECASCHDPHTDVNPTFLRISNTGSRLCLACHIK
jgi:predicted CXXCH cytochrome family protein